MSGQTLPVFARFIADLRAVWRMVPDEAARIAEARKLLEALVLDPVIRAHSRAWPSTEGRRNLVLYEDPEFDFVINAVVRAPDHVGNIHDHVHAWILYGLVDGTETIERFERLDDGTDGTRAELRRSQAIAAEPGTVDLVEPYAIHAEQGGPTRSAAIIVRSSSIPGRTMQHQYERDGSVTERPVPTQVPFELVE